MNRLLNLHDGTGIVSLSNMLSLILLDQIVVFPVQDDNQWIDGEEKILPGRVYLETEYKPRILPITFIANSEMVSSVEPMHVRKEQSVQIIRCQIRT